MEKRDVWERVKWNGWGDKSVYLGINHRGNVENSRTGIELPKVVPFAKSLFGLDELEHTPSVELEEIQIPEPRSNEPFVKALKSVLQPSQISFDKEQRICHTYGSSFRDLWRLRRGIISDPPDCVVYPQSHEDVERIVAAANAHKVALVPGGGRTNIVGAVEAQSLDGRFVVSLDMRRMNRLLWVDRKTMTACFEVGVLGPDLEASLKKEGLGLGHDPDSFEWSTLGGWLATCSSGMQSDKYGDIEDMCLSLKVVTPNAGTITTPPAARNGAGPTLKHFFIGTEGALGIITQATMIVHKLPEVKEFHGLLFPSWEQGAAAIHSLYLKEVHPSMIRLYDADETRLSFNLKPKTSPWVQMVSDLTKKFLEKFKGYDLNSITLMIVGFEGEATNIKFLKKQAFKILKDHGGFWVGTGPGQSWYEKRYDLPLLRDLLLDRGLWVDVAETAVSWSNVLLLWKDVKQSILDAMQARGVPGWVGAHISHSYSSGVCVYFTFASVQISESSEDELNLYIEAKKAATEAVLRNHGALSHHHGVGFEHVPFMARYFDAGGLKTLRGLKEVLDPNNICNPGKLIPAEGEEDMNFDGHQFYKRGLVELAARESGTSEGSSIRGKGARKVLRQPTKSQL